MSNAVAPPRRADAKIRSASSTAASASASCASTATRSQAYLVSPSDDKIRRTLIESPLHPFKPLRLFGGRRASNGATRWKLYSQTGIIGSETYVPYVAPWPSTGRRATDPQRPARRLE